MDLTKVGEYSIQAGGKNIKFWPVGPGVTVESFEWSPERALFAPEEKNTITVLPDFAIFDILIEFSPDPVVEETIDSEAILPLQFQKLAGKPSQFKMPLVRAGEHTSHISFAVPVPKGKDEFVGALSLEVKLKDGNKAIRPKLNLKALKHTRVADLYVFFVVHKKFASNTYCWFKSKVVQKSDGAPVAGVPVALKVLRDNFEKNGTAFINRRVELQSNADGFFSRDETRTVVGVPTKFPMIANAFWGDFRSRGFVNRGNLYRFKKQDIHNLAPELPPVPIRLIKSADANMAGKKILIDPGHGVVYSLKTDRRSQEWYAVHQIGHQVADILTGQFGCDARDIVFTRSAGIGMIEPDGTHHFKGGKGAPDDGDKRFQFDRVKRLVRAKTAAVTLKDISNLLLTTHAADNIPQPVSDADRTRLLTVNRQRGGTGAIDQIEDRLNTKLQAKGLQVQAGSVRWDPDHQDYVYTEERIAPKKGQDKIFHDHVKLPITTQDWFALDAAMLQVLFARSAKWSLACEVGGGPPAGASDTGCPEFQVDGCAAMTSSGAEQYMRRAVENEIGIDTSLGQYACQAWGPTTRRNYFNNNDCDLYLSIHLNATYRPDGWAKAACGVALEVATPTNTDQVRLSKVFIKYVDPFDTGLRQGGIPVPDKAVGLLNPTENHRIGKYAFFEVDFMDSLGPGAEDQFRYRDMLAGDFINKTAEQIVSGIVDYFFDPAALSQLDDVIYDGNLGVW